MMRADVSAECASPARAQNAAGAAQAILSLETEIARRPWALERRRDVGATYNKVTRAHWLNTRTSGGYRLPTEAKWEYAARGGDRSGPYPWGASASHDHANYGGEHCDPCHGGVGGRDRWVRTSPAASFPANAFGLYDMHGNVWEWAQDCFERSLNSLPIDSSARESETCQAVYQALITDLFERITLYDARVILASSAPRSDGRWDVTMIVEARKLYADGDGQETEAPLDEEFEFGVFTAEPGEGAFSTEDVVAFERRLIRNGRQTVTMIADREPRFAGIDPYNKRLDRNSDDNVLAVTRARAAPKPGGWLSRRHPRACVGGADVCIGMKQR